MINCISIVIFFLSGFSVRIQGVHLSMLAGHKSLSCSGLRGGSSLLMDNQTLPEEDGIHEIQIQVHKQGIMKEKRRIHSLDADRVALALRLTCQLNRRTLAHMFYDEFTIQNHAAFYSKGYISSPHLKQNIVLEKYIQQLYDVFDYQNIPLIPALTMIYLDRACSTDVPRKMSDGESSYSCPMLDMGNIHKLFLVANLLAIRAYRHQIPVDENYLDEITLQLHSQFLESSSPEIQRWVGNISTIELANMMQWMVASMGYKGIAVSLHEVNQLIQRFSTLFEDHDLGS